MLRMIVSLVISLVLVMSPAVGQLINQQTTLFQQQLYTDKTNNPGEDITGVHMPVNVNEGQGIAPGTNALEEPRTVPKMATEVPKLTPPAKATEIPKAAPPTIATEIPKTALPTIATETSKATSTAKTTETSKTAPTAKIASAPKFAPTAKTTEKPKAVPTTKATTEPPKSTPAEPKATAELVQSKAPAVSTPETTKAPKPTDSPKSPVESSVPEKESAPASSDKVFDTSKVKSGTIGVRYLNTSGKRVKLLVVKGSSSYNYNLDGKGSLETFPLQSGNGEYTISILENTEGKTYKFILSEKIQVSISNTNSAYLGSIQMINWNSSMSAIKKAADLTSGISGDEARLKKIYNYVVKNIDYDSDKLGTLPSTYIPSVNDTYSSKSGICYDFASLTASMLRSVGIPTKLIMGYAKEVNGYHAWNEVYIDGKWITIDTSYDSQMREAGVSYSMKKSSSEYQTSKTY